MEKECLKDTIEASGSVRTHKLVYLYNKLLTSLTAKLLRTLYSMKHLSLEQTQIYSSFCLTMLLLDTVFFFCGWIFVHVRSV